MLIMSLETKKCMNKLLLTDTFDSYLFIEGEITTFNTFRIDGYLKKEFYDSETTEIPAAQKYSKWREVRDFCFSLIKGKRTPLDFKLVFSLSPENIEKFITSEALPFAPENVQGLYLNFKFDGTSLSCTTGTSMNVFTLDKSLEQAWDKMVQKIFGNYGINYEILR